MGMIAPTSLPDTKKVILHHFHKQGNPLNHLLLKPNFCINPRKKSHLYALLISILRATYPIFSWVFLRNQWFSNASITLSIICLSGMKVLYSSKNIKGKSLFNKFASILVIIFTITLHKDIFRISVIYFRFFLFGMSTTEISLKWRGIVPDKRICKHSLTTLVPIISQTSW